MSSSSSSDEEEEDDDDDANGDIRIRCWFRGGSSAFARSYLHGNARGRIIIVVVCIVAACR